MTRDPKARSIRQAVVCLQYAKSISRHRRVFGLAILVFVITVVAMVPKFGSIGDAVCWHWAWYRCRLFHLYPESVVYEEGRRSEVRPPPDALIVRMGNDNVVAWGRRLPGAFQSLWEQNGNRPSLVNSAMNNPVVFADELTTPDGIRTLVTVQVGDCQEIDATFSYLIADSWNILASRQPNRWKGETPVYLTNGRREDRYTKGRFRLYAGKRDEADPSHFVVRYEVGAQSGLIDGWLRSEFSIARVLMRYRNGPGALIDLSNEPAPAATIAPADQLSATVFDNGEIKRDTSLPPPSVKQSSVKPGRK